MRKKILISLLIGLVAGVIDTIPMILQNIDMHSCISAFVQWLMLAFIIPYVNWDIKPWIKGFIIAEMMALPVMILVVAADKFQTIPILIFSGILGSLVGWAGGKFIKNERNY